MPRQARRPDVEGIVPDQGEKLLYLIKTRGDQRTRNTRRPGEVLDDESKDFASLRIVTSQASLAEVLGTSIGTVNRWIANSGRHNPNPINVELRRKLCKIYSIPLSAFNTQSYDDFVKGFQDQIEWHELVAEAPIGHGRVLNESPYIGIRYAEAAFGVSENPAAQVPIETPFWVEFTSPRTNKDRSDWAGWHVLLFNRDVHQSGFTCYLPKFRNKPEFAIEVFPQKGDRLALPRKPILKHRRRSDIGGKFEMVLLLCRDAPPAEIMRSLSKVEPIVVDKKHLDSLAQWVHDPLRQGIAVITRVPYVVVDKSGG